MYDYNSGVSSLEQTRGTFLRLVPKGGAVNGVYHLKNDVAMKEAHHLKNDVAMKEVHHLKHDADMSCPEIIWQLNPILCVRLKLGEFNQFSLNTIFLSGFLWGPKKSTNTANKTHPESIVGGLPLNPRPWKSIPSVTWSVSFKFHRQSRLRDVMLSTIVGGFINLFAT